MAAPPIARSIVKINTKAVRREQTKQAHRASKQQMLRSIIDVDCRQTPREPYQTPFHGSMRPASTKKHWKGAERARVRTHLRNAQQGDTSARDDLAPMSPTGKVPIIAYEQSNQTSRREKELAVSRSYFS